jgi:hypothetical protein
MIIVIISYWCYHKRKKRRLAQKQKSVPRLTSVRNPNPEDDSSGNDHPTYLHTIVSLVGLKYDDIQLELESETPKKENDEREKTNQIPESLRAVTNPNFIPDNNPDDENNKSESKSPSVSTVPSNQSEPIIQSVPSAVSPHQPASDITRGRFSVKQIDSALVKEDQM